MIVKVARLSWRKEELVMFTGIFPGDQIVSINSAQFSRRRPLPSKECGPWFVTHLGVKEAICTDNLLRFGLAGGAGHPPKASVLHL